VAAVKGSEARATFALEPPEVVTKAKVVVPIKKEKKGSK
jgi:hypothetical protein